MGICASCLGLRTRSEDSETARLIYDDHYRPQYGTHAQITQRPVYQPDPESVKREREALDAICHTMSDNVIDVFTIQPQAKDGGLGARSVSSFDGKSNASDGFGESSSEDLKLRTIRRGQGGPIFSTLGRGAGGWKAVQEAIG